MKANSAEEPVFRVPLRAGNPIKFVWVGDLNGDGEYDYIVDRQGNPQTIEAYLNDGTFLWSVNLGPNSANQNNIEPGSSTIDVGNWDGVTVYDFDNDGIAEVAIKIANGVVFGDGTTWSNSDNNKQWIAFLNGQTGAMRAYVALPRDYIADGPLAARFGVGVLDGTTPHLVAVMKNRQDGGAFNLIECAYTFKGSNAVQKWCWKRDSQNAPDGHNTRIIDVDANGSDEVVEIGYCLNGDGSLRYSLGPSGKFPTDPDHPLLQGFTPAQRNRLLARPRGYDKWTPRILAEYQSIGGSATFKIGSGATVADEIERWVTEADVDGFNIGHIVVPGAWEDVIKYLTPELERRGWLGTGDYNVPGGTARENLYSTPGQPHLRQTHPGYQYKTGGKNWEKSFVSGDESSSA